MFQVQIALWLEGVNKYFVVSFPRVKGRGRPCGHQSIPLNTAAAWIISGDDDLSSKEVITKPHLVFGEKPMRVVRDIKLSVGIARRW